MIIDPRNLSQNDGNDSPAIFTARKVHAELAALLIDCYGGRIRPGRTHNPERVIDSGVVGDFGFNCQFGVAMEREAYATLTVTICVGRFYCGYRKALRWLANNRASNTVSIAFVEQHARDAELWLTCTRATTPGDSAGLRATLSDIRHELGVVDAGVRIWFSQILRGERLMEFKEASLENNDIRSMLTSPQAFLDHARQHPKEEASSEFISEAHGWLGQWDEHLRQVDRVASELVPDRKDFLWERACPLLKLRRYEELIGLCAELESLADESEKPIVAGVIAQALYERGEFEEALDVLRSATLDSGARVWLYRCLAHARLGHGGEAMESYSEYERLVGKDIIAEKMVGQVMPEPEWNTFG